MGDPPPNVIQAVPFFGVANMEASLRFYVDGLGFKVTKTWEPNGKIRWCWLELGGAAIMLQQHLTFQLPISKPGEGISICFQCLDAVALYLQFTANGLEPKTPCVGNGMWVTVIADPDGYKLDFESATDAPEESIYGAAPELQRENP